MDRNTLVEGKWPDSKNTTKHRQTPYSEKNESINIVKISEKTRCLADRFLRLRENRNKIFANGLFNDPAWDILLNLYSHEKAKEEICIAHACIAAGVPASTGLRWITILIQNGYVERHDDPADMEQSLLGLTATARDALDTLFLQFESN